MSAVAKTPTMRQARAKYLTSDFTKLSDAARSHLFEGDCRRATQALVGLARVRGEAAGAGVEISDVAYDTFEAIHRQVFRQCVRGAENLTGAKRRRR